MTTYYHLTPKSSNTKTGPIPVSTTSKDTCPASCSFKGDQGCYAEYGPLGLHWNKVSTGERGTDLDEFCKKIMTLPEGQLWRHNQAGDLPGDGRNINCQGLSQLVAANLGKNGFTYTHYDPLVNLNGAYIKVANLEGFTINLSADTQLQAVEYKALDKGPVCVVVPEDYSDKSWKFKGQTFTICPAVYTDEVSCETCKICVNPKRNAIVAFPVHGAKKGMIK